MLGDKTKDTQQARVRELFIEELVEVQGGVGVEDLFKKIQEQLQTTHGCCEEFPPSCC